jgi:hypothetical protein
MFYEKSKTKLAQPACKPVFQREIISQKTEQSHDSSAAFSRIPFEFVYLSGRRGIWAIFAPECRSDFQRY